MKVLWITNNLLPDICEHLGIPIVEKTGWLHSAANQIKKSVDLHVAALYSVRTITQLKINGINYILIPRKQDHRKYDATLYSFWRNIHKTIAPDVVHIHGTEYPTGLTYILANGSSNVVISIQGLISECSKHYNAGMSFTTILKHTTLRDIVKRETLWQGAKNFAKQGIYEQEYLKKGINFIGRTLWDNAYIKVYNPSAIYYFNNETLRNTFYYNNWSIEHAEKHTLFYSQATYPLKGLHILLKAMPYILQRYPDTTIKVAGYDITKVCTSVLIGKMCGTTYGYYLYSLITKYNLQNRIHFLGKLNEQEMCNAYLTSHIFVSASRLENSSNSIGEAQLLGVPVVTSFVGGNDTMAVNNETALMYPFDDIIRLAHNILRIFDNKKLALELSEKGRMAALKRHDKNANKTQLLNIYKEIANHHK